MSIPSGQQQVLRPGLSNNHYIKNSRIKTKTTGYSNEKRLSNLTTEQLLAAASNYASGSNNYTKTNLSSFSHNLNKTLNTSTTTVSYSSTTTTTIAKYQVSTVDKHAKRIAHVPNKTPSLKKNHSIMPIPHTSTKIPLSVRRNFLFKLHTELSVNNSNDFENEMDILNLSKEYEHEICSRSKGIKSIYVSLSASKIQTIRTERNTTATLPVTNLSQNTKKYKHLISTAPVKPLTKVSHEAILNSKATNCSVLKKEKISFSDLSKMQLLRILNKMTIPENKLIDYGFPRPHKYMDGMARSNINQTKVVIDYKEGIRITCRRCRKDYINPQPEDNPPCLYHFGKMYRYERYSCCNGDDISGGCSSSKFHVTDGYEFNHTWIGFQETKSSQEITPEVYALDCEMASAHLFVCNFHKINFLQISLVLY